MKKFILQILGIFIVWRVILFLATIFGILMFSAPGDANLSSGIFHAYKNVWNFWDGGFYHDIAQTGYHEPPNSAFGGFPVRTAFFPMYPFLVRLLSKITTLDISISQLIVSGLATAIAVVFIGLLIKKIADEKTALWTVIALLMFPFSYFFAAGYSEATFLMFVAGFFYFLLAKKNIYLASLFAFGASATRPVGLSLLVVLAVHYIWNYKARKSFTDIFAFIISGLGTVVYMIYLKIRFDDPLLFIQAQKGWRGGIGGNFVVNIWHDLFKLFPKEATIDWTLLFFERLALPLVVLAGIYLIYKYKKQYLELSTYLAISITLPVITGTFGSLNRLVIVIFPLFFAIALLLKRRPLVFYSYILISQAFLIFWTIFYTHSKWTG